MYKILKPNDNYMIDVDTLQLEKVNQEPLDLETNGDMVKISLYGNVKWVTLTWLKWLAYYDITLPIEHRDRIFDIEFHKQHTSKFKLRDNVMVNIKKPIYVDKEKKYRLCLRFPDYAVSEDGLFKRVASSIPVPTVANKVYVTVCLYDRSTGYKTTLMMHRLMGLVWHYNDNFEKRPIINHKNGDTRDFHANNLEWCTFTENNRHAVQTNLRTDNYRVYTRNIDTGEIVEHESTTVASLFMGRARINLEHTPLKDDYIWKGANGRFELKRYDNDTPWYYLNNPIVDLNRKYTRYTVTYKDGGMRVFYNKETLTKEYLDTTGVISTDILIQRIKDRYPNIVDIKFENTQYKAEAYEARNTTTGEICEGKTNLELAQKIGIGKSTVTKAISKQDNARLYNGWQIRYKSDDPWGEVTEVPDNTPVAYRVEHNGTTTTTIVPSVRQLANLLNRNRQTLTNYFKTNKVLQHNDYTITLLN